MTTEFVLWGFHPKGPDGSVSGHILTGGSLAWCRVAQAYYGRDASLQLSIHPTGVTPAAPRQPRIEWFGGVQVVQP